MCPEMEFIGQRVYTYYFWCHIFKSFERRESERALHGLGAAPVGCYRCPRSFPVVLYNGLCVLSLPASKTAQSYSVPSSWVGADRSFLPQSRCFLPEQNVGGAADLTEFLADLGSQGGKLRQAGSGGVSTATAAQRLSWPETHDKHLTIRKHFQAQAEEPESKTKGRSSRPA